MHTANRFNLLDGYSARHAKPHAPSPRVEHNGKHDGQKAEESSEGSSRYRLSPTPDDHLPGEPASLAASSRLCPDIIPFTLGRVESSFRVLRLPDILATFHEMRRELSQSLETLDPSLAELIAEPANGARSHEPKVAFMPLASVGHPQADGRLLALGLAPRKSIPLKTRLRLSEALRRIPGKKLTLGQLGVWRIEPLAHGSLPQNLLVETWTGQPQGAIEWATVTPIVLEEPVTETATLCEKMARAIRLAGRREGLPEPCEIIITPVSAHFGAPPAEEFARAHPQGGKRPLRHAILIFPSPVRGPILLGAGRQAGYGLCRPMPEGVVDH